MRLATALAGTASFVYARWSLKVHPRVQHETKRHFAGGCLPHLLVLCPSAAAIRMSPVRRHGAPQTAQSACLCPAHDVILSSARPLLVQPGCWRKFCVPRRRSTAGRKRCQVRDCSARCVYKDNRKERGTGCAAFDVQVVKCVGTKQHFSSREHDLVRWRFDSCN